MDRDALRDTECYEMCVFSRDCPFLRTCERAARDEEAE